MLNQESIKTLEGEKKLDKGYLRKTRKLLETKLPET